MTAGARSFEGPRDLRPQAVGANEPATVGSSDPDALLRALRGRIAAARRRGEPADSIPAGLDAAAASLAQAAAVADVGTTVPPFAHLSLPRRLVARLSGQILLYFLRVITIDQRHFNHLVLAVLRGQARDTGALHARFDALAAVLDTGRDERHALRVQLAADREMLRAQAAALDTARDERHALRAQLAGLVDGMAAERAVLHAQVAALAELRDTGALLLIQTDALKRRRAAPERANAPAANGGETERVAPVSPIDQLLVAEAFRGKEDAIKDRQRRYVAYFDGCDGVLDVGCGRGEFLHLLRGAGISAQGVDLDEDLVLWCQERGLAVRCMDALAYLAELPDGELGGIFCAQVVEHLRTDDLLRFVDLAFRKLRPHGRIVIETLNPESLLVLYRWFWMDLTHERLVHPETLQFLLRSGGFQDVTCHFVPPPPGPLHIPPLQFAHDPPPQLQEFNAATQYLNQLLYASFDYAVVAVR
jgi:SAM-dependent methyltransferase